MKILRSSRCSQSRSPPHPSRWTRTSAHAPPPPPPRPLRQSPVSVAAASDRIGSGGRKFILFVELAAPETKFRCLEFFLRRKKSEKNFKQVLFFFSISILILISTDTDAVSSLSFTDVDDDDDGDEKGCVIIVVVVSNKVKPRSIVWCQVAVAGWPLQQNSLLISARLTDYGLHDEGELERVGRDA